MKVLFIVENGGNAPGVKEMLGRAKINVFFSEADEDVVDLAKRYDHDLILLDLGVAGHECLCRLRAAGVTTPVMVLSRRSDIGNIVRCFSAGADDYLIKPYNHEELVARIHAIIRRSRGPARSVIKTGKVSVNLDVKTVTVEGGAMHLTGKEYQMLELLSLRKGTTLTKEMFLNHLYGSTVAPELKIIDVFICKLRKKLTEATGGDNYIETVWGRGYVLRDPAQEQKEAE